MQKNCDVNLTWIYQQMRHDWEMIFQSLEDKLTGTCDRTGTRRSVLTVCPAGHVTHVRHVPRRKHPAVTWFQVFVRQFGMQVGSFWNN